MYINKVLVSNRDHPFRTFKEFLSAFFYYQIQYNSIQFNFFDIILFINVNPNIYL